MWVKFARLILKNRVAILIVLSILTIAMGYMGSRVHISYEYAVLLPETDTAYKEFVKFKDDFGADANSLIVGLKTDKLFNKPVFTAYNDMCDSLSAIDGVESMMSVAQAVQISGSQITRFFPDTTLTQKELDSISELVLNQPLYEGMLYNEDKNVFLLLVTIRQSILDCPDREALMARITGIVDSFSEEQSIETFITGMPYIRTQTSLRLQNELKIFVILAVLVCAILLFIVFRSLKNVMFSMLVVGVSVIWVLGWMGLFDYELSMLSTMLSPLIIVISVPNCVFILNKFHQEYAKHGNKIKALQRVIYKVGNAVFLSNLTTAIGLATFMITESKMFQEFGLIASLGILGVFFFSMTLLPIIFSFLAPPSEQMLKHLESKMFSKVVNGIMYITENKRNVIYITTCSLLLVAIIGLFKIQTTGYVVDDLPHDDDVMVNLRFAEKTFNGVLPLEIQIEDSAKINLMRDKAFLRKVDQLTDSLRTYSEIASPLSIIDFMKFAWQSHNGGDPNYYTLPNSSDMFFQNKMKKLAKKASNGMGGLQYSLVDSTGTKIRIRCNVKDIGTQKMAELEKDLQEDISAIFPSDRYKSLITGTSIVYFKGAQYLLKNLAESLTFAILLIALFMAILFRSKRMVLVSLIPNILPLFFTAAVMGFGNIPIKTSTILVFSIAFGISIDDTIHFLSRYRQSLKSSDWNIRKSVEMAIQETSPSMIATSIILFFGFGVFTFSQFDGTKFMGVLVSFTLFVAMLFNNILLPSLLLTLDKRITNKHFQEPLLDIYNEEEDIELEDLQIE